MASRDVKEILEQMKLDGERLQDTVRQIALNMEAMIPALVEMAKALSVIAARMPVVPEEVEPPSEPAKEGELVDLVRRILISEEGYKEVVYPSPEGGNPTAGIGHKLLDSEMPKWGSIGTPVPKSQLEVWYSADVYEATSLARKFLGGTWGELSTLRRALVVCQCFQMGDLSDWGPTLAHIRAKEWDDVRDHIMASKWGRVDSPGRASRMATMWVTDTLLDRYREVDLHLFV